MVSWRITKIFKNEIKMEMGKNLVGSIKNRVEM